MNKDFSNLNRYERAYLKSLKNKRVLREKKSFWNFLFRKRKKYNMKVDRKNIPNKIYRKRLSIKKQTTNFKRKRKRNNTIKNIFFTIGTLIFIFLIFFIFWFNSLEIPDVSNFQQRKISNSTKIYDKTGEIILYDIHNNIQRTAVNYDEINQFAKDSIVAIEDHTFYEHKGVVIKSTLRAVFQTLLSKAGLSNQGTAGGSTLTQQVVKNTLLNSKRLVSRKVKEWVLAYKIEQQLSKNQILEIYLNEAPYGGTIYGIEEAAREFFGVTANELTLAQAAYLAAIPNLPTYYSPYGPNKSKLDERQNIVLSEMKRYGYISNLQYREALLENVEFLTREDNAVKALHFVQYIRAYLEKEYGNDLVENGGLKVITTLDYGLQQKAEIILKEHIEEVEELYESSNSALVALEARTGQIITMVGSRDYFDEEIDGNFNVALAHRQPGSSFKPIAYANAFEKGYLPETVVFDVQTEFNSSCRLGSDSIIFNDSLDSKCYTPMNFDSKFKGPFTLRNALAQSRNIPAIKVLYLGGIEETLKLASDFGINSLVENANFYGLSLVLGGGDVSLLELTGAYSVFANEGNLNEITGILSIEDSNGNILEEYNMNEKRVISENSARMISDILSDNRARTPLLGSQSFFHFGDIDVAGKTGTTNDNRDALVVGYTPLVAVGVWTGNNDNSPMKKGSSISGKPWRRFFDEVLMIYEHEKFNNYELPSNYVELPPVVRGIWGGNVQGIIKQTPEDLLNNIQKYAVDIDFEPHNILHYISKDNPANNLQQIGDSQYNNWEFGVQSYIEENYEFIVDNEEDKEGDEDNENQESGISIRTVGLKNKDRLDLDERIDLRVNFRGINIDNISRVDFFINGLFIDSDLTNEFSTEISLARVSSLMKENILQIVATTGDSQKIKKNINFFVKDFGDNEDVVVTEMDIDESSTETIDASNL